MSFLFNLHRTESREGRSDSSDRGPSRSRSPGRSLSPFRRKKRDSSAEGLRRDSGGESEPESDSAPVVCPSNSFDDSDEDSEEELEWGEEDEEMERNTELNASERTPYDFLKEEGPVVYPGEGPNLVSPLPSSDPYAPFRTAPVRRKSTKLPALSLHTSRPIYEKNRVTVQVTQGDPAAAREKRQGRTYLVASDLSEESLFAIQWAIGTVIREGDELQIVSVIETDTKFDVDGDKETAADRKAKFTNRRDREANAQLLSKQATALLERTRLNVSIICQAIHAKNVRHMLLDIIDYLEPTLVIVGTRGLDKIKGMLLGSVSNYLIQKSSSPVMVTRRPLRVSRTVHRKLSSLNREARTTLAGAQTEKESKGGEVEEGNTEPEDIHEQVQNMSVHEAGSPRDEKTQAQAQAQLIPPQIAVSDAESDQSATANTTA